MGNTAVVNNTGVRLKPIRDNGEAIHSNRLNFVDAVYNIFQNPQYEHLFKSHKFLSEDPQTGNIYPRGKNTGFWRHKDSKVRDNTSQQYKYFLNNPDYQCGKCWTVEEIIVYYLQAFENSKTGKLEEFYEEHLMRTNRLIEHLIKWNPQETTHLIDYYITLKTY